MVIVRKLLSSWSIVINCEAAVTILISSNSRSISCCSWRSLSWLPTLSRPALDLLLVDRWRNLVQLITGIIIIRAAQSPPGKCVSADPLLPRTNCTLNNKNVWWCLRPSNIVMSSSNTHYHTLSPSSLMYTIIIHHHPFWHDHHPQDQPPDLTGQCSSSPFPHQPPELSSRNPCFTKSTWSGGSWSRSSPRSPTWPTAGQTLAHRALVKISPISEWRVLSPHTARLGNNCTLTSVAYKFTAMSSTKLL